MVRVWVGIWKQATKIAKDGWHINKVGVSPCRCVDDGLPSLTSHSHISMGKHQNIEALKI